MDGDFEPVLRVFGGRSEYEPKSGVVEVFLEGPSTADSRSRFKIIESWLANDGLQELIEAVKDCPDEATIEDASVKADIDELVGSVTSERGRALVALTVMQLAIKTSCPAQSVRLHKGGRSHGAERFSWSEGVSMRSLDRNYVTPFLRQHHLLRLNADGFMMTRSLAENYPYTLLYKAALRGGRQQWLSLTEAIEQDGCEPERMLKYLLSVLLNRSAAFASLAESVIKEVDGWLGQTDLSLDAAISWVEGVVRASEYSARVFEISIHSFFQALEELRKLPSPLKPLSQMRSANKKHGNVGDIELLHRTRSSAIVEAWDAKFGKPYLRDELEELGDKLANHPETEIAGFVTSEPPDLTADIEERRLDLEGVHDVSVRFLDFSSWVTESAERFQATDNTIAAQWIRCIVGSLAQHRRHTAPIDEPCEAWLRVIREQVPMTLPH